ncbi:metalloregulator ArsR/SmtB family transcription factor [Pseudooceanicola sp. 216_PA32_1]|uniref:Metalloregulator ArsR/SmtB family transcription factor n=1 Tax=Pseudooceanicola pacificus TaxID=2676438 RepID=A0A844W8W3_9RHOB|nr:winged helix-turn-helix domain-containing protein [Pseudooceanicola pacificus]MWB79294.1 metalloregulator ArsR/SmtB family transcription factor [Pseudooceanicola pacificus]
MREGPDIARIAALIGDPARANILTALLSGKALTATELAAEAGVTAQTASTHLARLAEGGLIETRRQGRHKYVTLASEEVAAVLEALTGLAAGQGHLRTRTGPKDAELRRARVCYNHLAGDMGVRLFESMAARRLLEVRPDGVTLAPAGQDFVSAFGIDLAALRSHRTPLCLPCLDWSERRSHLAGSLGRAMLTRMQELGWLRRAEGRLIRVTARGETDFARAFPV